MIISVVRFLKISPHQRSDELEIVLNRGGFSLKGVTFSHQKPNKKLSVDGESINVVSRG